MKDLKCKDSKLVERRGNSFSEEQHPELKADPMRRYTKNYSKNYEAPKPVDEASTNAYFPLRGSY